MGNIKKLLLHPQYTFMSLGHRGFFDWMDDKKYLEIAYRLKMGKKLNLTPPLTFNEKIQWLKLYDRKPEYFDMVDKAKVKKLVAELIGEEYVIPTLGVWNQVDDIDFEKLPNKFVLKCTHNSGGLIICKDKDKLDVEKAKKQLAHSMKYNYYPGLREWPYKGVEPRIIAEKYMQDGDDEHLKVYKFFNFSGEPKIIQVITNDKTKDETIDYFDCKWNRLDLRQNFPNSLTPPPMPSNLDDMLSISRKLSQGHPFIRIDLYSINGAVYFSEFTFYTDSGLAKFYPEEWEYKLGNLIVLPER